VHAHPVADSAHSVGPMTQTWNANGSRPKCVAQTRGRRKSSDWPTSKGESSKLLCDRRLQSRTRAPTARQLPTNHGHAVPIREYQNDSSSLPLGRGVRRSLSVEMVRSKFDDPNPHPDLIACVRAPVRTHPDSSRNRTTFAPLAPCRSLVRVARRLQLPMLITAEAARGDGWPARTRRRSRSTLAR
jgi:hypothetical protein